MSGFPPPGPGSQPQPYSLLIIFIIPAVPCRRLFKDTNQNRKWPWKSSVLPHSLVQTTDGGEGSSRVSGASRQEDSGVGKTDRSVQPGVCGEEPWLEGVRPGIDLLLIRLPTWGFPVYTSGNLTDESLEIRVAAGQRLGA